MRTRIMKAKEYLRASKSVTIKVIGFKSQKAQPIERSPTATVIAVLERKVEGKLRFIDHASFIVDKLVNVHRLELWYSNKLVGVREIPEIQLKPSDKLDITWECNIVNSQPIFEIRC